MDLSCVYSLYSLMLQCVQISATEVVSKMNNTKDDDSYLK